MLLAFFPYSVFDCWFLAPLALILDLLLGDPPLPWPHPVVFQGRFLYRMEGRCRQILTLFPQSRLLPRLLGAFTLLALLLLTGFVLLFFLSIPFLGPLFALYFSWAGLAMGSLLDTGRRVLWHIHYSPLKRARRALSSLVSRDTRFMDRALLEKTLADTVTENFTDALTAPFFWLLLGGPVGLWLYKAVSTGDSMWGYLTPKWRYLGFAFARMDDVLAFIPARLSILAIAFSDAFTSLFTPKSRSWAGHLPPLLALHKEALGMPSPNSGCPMAAFAWLMQAKMAGPSVYFGTTVEKPWLGPKESFPWDAQRLSCLLSCMQRFALIGMLFLWAFSFLLIFFFRV